AAGGNGEVPRRRAGVSESIRAFLALAPFLEGERRSKSVCAFRPMVSAKQGSANVSKMLIESQTLILW
ncbi:hypothetical protein, partial [Serratia marcescens]|uniref:hypothetical protein n=1 Tax=Serratia marcescens TaxID=615 RepID=UPI001C7CF8F1